MPNSISRYEAGFGMDDTDHTDEQILHDIRVFEGLMYSRAVEALVGTNFTNGVTGYEATFLGGVSELTKPGLYVHGPAAAPTLSGFDISGLGGLIHLASSTANANTPAASPGLGTNVYDRYWVTYFGQMPTETFATNSDATLSRWDLVSLAPSIGTSPTITRDFEDAITGAKTTGNVARFSVVEEPDILITQGSLGGGVPATPSGRVAWCAVRIPPLDAPPTYLDDSGVPGIIDFSIPVQEGTKRLLMPGRLGFGDSSWTPGMGHLASTGPGSMIVVASALSEQILLLPPQHWLGDAFAACVGVRIFHANGPCISAIEWVRVKFNGALNVGPLNAADYSVLATIAAGTSDGQARVITAAPQFSTPGAGTIWGNGYAAGRTFFLNGSFAPGLAAESVSTLGILITRDNVSDGDEVAIQSVEWIFAR